MNRCGKLPCDCNPILGAKFADGRVVTGVHRHGGFIAERGGRGEMEWYPNDRFAMVDGIAVLLAADGFELAPYQDVETATDETAYVTPGRPLP